MLEWPPTSASPWRPPTTTVASSIELSQREIARARRVKRRARAQPDQARPVMQRGLLQRGERRVRPQVDRAESVEKSSRALGPEERRFVYAVVRRIGRTDQDADDVAQDALLLAHQHVADFRGDSRFRTWLHRIATTTALGHLRRKRRARSHVPTHEVPLVDPAKSAEAAMAAAQIDSLVRDAVSTLEPAYRDVLVARAQASEAEVAARLGISLASVKIRGYRARKQLRGMLEQAMGEAFGGAA
jgi:RNA polymerase sigma-70 factor, ECF subfamily